MAGSLRRVALGRAVSHLGQRPAQSAFQPACGNRSLSTSLVGLRRLGSLWVGLGNAGRVKPGIVVAGAVGGATIGVGLMTRRHVLIAACQPAAPMPAAVSAKPLRDSGKKEKKELTLSTEDFGLLWSLLKQDLWLLVSAVGSALAAAFLNVELSKSIGRLVNAVTQGGVDAMATATLGMLTAASLQGACTFGYIWLLSTVGERLCERMRNQLYRALLYQDISFFDEHKQGELVDRLSSDVGNFKSAFKQVVSLGLRNSTQAIGSIVAMLMISPKLATIVVLTVPPIILGGTVIGSMLRHMSSFAKDAASEATGLASEIIGNIRTVRSFAMEEREVSEFAVLTAEARARSINLGIGIGLMAGLTNLFSNAVVLTVLYFGGHMIKEKTLDAGQLISFLVSAQTIQRSLQGLSMLFGSAVRGAEAGVRVLEYIKMRPGSVATGDTVLDEVAGELVFDDVSFVYPTRREHPVLENFDFTIPAGKVLALCGQSGSGKSTIAALIERFYDPTGGRVLLDGHDIRELDPLWLRGKMVGYINQEPVLFAASVYDNIRYGCPDATREQVESAAARANAHDFITDFPDGYGTMLGERGVTVSGGQRQRIAIARALLKNPPIMILDEATSALDAESEHLVQEALHELTGGRTVIVIAHRLSTIQNADSIVVMKRGQVMERGTHEQLLAKKGMYADLVQHQMSTA